MKQNAVILAAGDSQRMGAHKALLPFQNGINFLEACLKAFNDVGCAEVVVVVNKLLYRQIDSNVMKLQGHARFVLNEHPGRGRFFSLQCGLKALSLNTDTFFHNVDNPFVTSGVLAALTAGEHSSDIVSPAYMGRRGHPVLIRGRVVSDIISESNYDWNLRDYLDRYQHVSVPISDPNILVNINTPEEYARIRGNRQGDAKRSAD